MRIFGKIAAMIFMKKPTLGTDALRCVNAGLQAISSGFLMLINGKVCAQ
jgi:hypothetical protein